MDRSIDPMQAFIQLSKLVVLAPDLHCVWKDGNYWMEMDQPGDTPAIDAPKSPKTLYLRYVFYFLIIIFFAN